MVFFCPWVVEVVQQWRNTLVYSNLNPLHLEERKCSFTYGERHLIQHSFSNPKNGDFQRGPCKTMQFPSQKDETEWTSPLLHEDMKKLYALLVRIQKNHKHMCMTANNTSSSSVIDMRHNLQSYLAVNRGFYSARMPITEKCEKKSSSVT